MKSEYAMTIAEALKALVEGNVLEDKNGNCYKLKQGCFMTKRNYKTPNQNNNSYYETQISLLDEFYFNETNDVEPLKIISNETKEIEMFIYTFKISENHYSQAVSNLPFEENRFLKKYKLVKTESKIIEVSE